MDLREGDLAESLNIWSSCGAALYSLIFQSVLPGGLLQFGFSNCPAGQQSPIDKLTLANRSGDRTRQFTSTIHVSQIVFQGILHAQFRPQSYIQSILGRRSPR